MRETQRNLVDEIAMENSRNFREKDHPSGTQTSLWSRILEDTRILCRMDAAQPETSRPKLQASNEINTLSKLARYLSGMGAD